MPHAPCLWENFPRFLRIVAPLLVTPHSLTCTERANFARKLQLVENKLSEVSQELEVSKEKYRTIRAKVSLLPPSFRLSFSTHCQLQEMTSERNRLEASTRTQKKSFSISRPSIDRSKADPSPPSPASSAPPRATLSRSNSTPSAPSPRMSGILNWSNTISGQSTEYDESEFETGALRSVPSLSTSGHHSS